MSTTKTTKLSHKRANQIYSVTTLVLKNNNK